MCLLCAHYTRCSSAWQTTACARGDYENITGEAEFTVTHFLMVCRCWVRRGRECVTGASAGKHDDPPFLGAPAAMHAGDSGVPARTGVARLATGGAGLADVLWRPLICVCTAGALSHAASGEVHGGRHRLLNNTRTSAD